MSREAKKLTLQYEFLKLELEEINEKLDQFGKDWSTRFGKYFVPEEKEMWENTETGERRETLPDEEETTTSKRKDSKLKNLYRKLSTKAHPDKGGSEEAFMKLKEVYEEDDYLALLNLASEYNLEHNYSEEDLNLFKKSVESVSNTIKEKKMTMMWQYYTGDANSKKFVLDQIEKIAGRKIDPEDLVD